MNDPTPTTEAASGAPPIRPPPAARWRRWAARLGLLVAAVLLSLALLEVGLRLAAPLDVRINSSWYQAHPVYQFRHRSHLDEEFVWVQPYHVRTNSRGLRESGEIPYEPDGSIRVVVHGDSLTFGNGCAAEDTFVRVAERELAAAAARPPVRLINFGVSAHSPGLEYLYYLEEGRRYHPRIVVIAAFCGNDVGDDVRFNAFRLDDAGQLVALPHRIPLLKRLTDADLYQWLIRRSQVVVRLRQVYNWFDVNVLTRSQVEGQAAVFQQAAAFDRNWPLSRAIWIAFAEAIRRDAATPLFAVIPTAEVIDRVAGRPAGEGMLPTAGAARDRLLALCAERGYDVLDLAVPLAAAGVPGDYHFNEAGHRIVGRALAARLADMLAGSAP